MVGEIQAEEARTKQMRHSDVAATNTSPNRRRNGSKKPSTRTNATGTSRKCEHCGITGHTQSDCWRKHPEKKPAHRRTDDQTKAAATETAKSDTMVTKTEIILPTTIVLATRATSPITEWVVDTACDDHMISSPDYFIPGTARKLDLMVHMAMTSKATVTTIGDVNIIVEDPSTPKNPNGRRIRLENVMYIPEMGMNLLSGIRMSDRNISANFKGRQLFISRPDGSTLATGRRTGKNWLLDVIRVEEPTSTSTVLATETTAESIPMTAESIPASSEAVETTSESIPSTPNLDKSRVNMHTWHRRLGHIGYRAVSETANLTEGMNITGLAVPKRPCGPCAIGKAHQSVRREPVLHRSKQAGDLLHIDVGGGGKLPKSLNNKAKYWVLAMDDWDGWMDIRFVRHKHNVKEAVKSIIKAFERNHETLPIRLHSATDIVEDDGTLDRTDLPRSSPPKGRRSVANIQSDRGGEFIDGQLQQWARDRNIQWIFTPPYTHQANGKIERGMRIVAERTRCILADTALPPELWEEIMQTVVFLRNLTPYHGRRYHGGRRQHDVGTPYELRHGTKPDLSFLAIPGSNAYVVHQADEVRMNPAGRHLANRAWIGQIVGYTGYHGAAYRIYRPYPNGPQFGSSGTIHIKRDIIVDEGSDWELYASPDDPRHQNRLQNRLQNDTETTPTPSDSGRRSIHSGDEHVHDERVYNDSEDESESASSTSSSSSSSMSSVSVVDTSHLMTETEPIRFQTTSKETRKRIQALNAATATTWNHETQCLRTTTKLTEFAAESLPDIGNTDTDMPYIEDRWMQSPRSLEEAQASPFWPWWHRAIVAEKKQLEELNTWRVVQPPAGTQLLSGKWVFKLKTDADGKPTRFKARWVARGFMQRQGIDYEDTVAATGRYETLRTLLAAILLKRFHTCQVDINLAYLNAKLNETIYMEYPHGFEDEANGKACLLLQSIYGLKQAAANWFHTLGDYLISKGFKRSNADHCLYTLRADQGVVAYIFVYVDDMLIAAESADDVSRIKRWLSSKWSITDLGPVTHYLGVKVLFTNTGELRIKQEGYLQRITNDIRSNIDIFLGRDSTNNKPPKRRAPATPCCRESPKSNKNVPNQRLLKLYQSAVGSLMFGTAVSRPDIAFSMSILARHLNNPTEEHLEDLDRANEYVASTIRQELVFKRQDDSSNGNQCSHTTVSGYVDASYASCPDTRRSRTGYVFTLAGGAIAWCSKQQSCVAKSSAEAEYMALSEAGSHGIWLKRLLNDLGIGNDGPVSLYTDSLSAMAITLNNHKSHGKTRHIETHWHWIREQVESKRIRLIHIPGQEQPADALTKPLERTKLNNFKQKMGFDGLCGTVEVS